MTKLKLSPVQDENPVKVSVTLSATVYRDLAAYAEILARESGQKVEPAKLIAPMLKKFIASDRGFAKSRRSVMPNENRPSSIQQSAMKVQSPSESAGRPPLAPSRSEGN